MSIVIIRQDDKIEAWKKAIQAYDSSVQVFSYLQPHEKDKVKVALVWKHPKDSLNAYPHLKYIASSGAGVDFIFEDDSAPIQIPITRVVDQQLAIDMSEHVLALLLNYLKNFDAYKLNQTKKIWQSSKYLRIKDVTVGILGLGELGTQVAKDLVHVGFKVQGWSNTHKNVERVTSFAGESKLNSFLKTTDVLVCLLPLTSITTGILNKTLFQQLPKNAYVINVARGGHLVDEDLLEALQNGHLSGAALDVYHQEPLPTIHAFWANEKIVMTPHYASVSEPESVVPQLIENYKRMEAGLPLLNIVSMDKGY